MDEYIGLPENAPQSFGRWLKEAIFDRVRPGEVHYVNGRAKDVAAECDKGQHHCREDDVELLLDGQRPRVPERRGSGHDVGVGRAVEDQLPVGEVPQRPQRVLPEAIELPSSRPGRAVEADTSDQQQQRRSEAPGPTQVEGSQVEAAGRGHLVHDDRCDEEPGQHEEDVDAQEPARQSRGGEVVDEDRCDSDAAQPVKRTQARQRARPILLSGFRPQPGRGRPTELVCRDQRWLLPTEMPRR